MKKLFILLSAVISNTFVFAQQFDYQNVSLYSRFDDSTVVAEPADKIRYNSVWGYVDPVSKKEYAILGATSGTYIIDVTNPVNPVQVGFFAGRRTGCIWREYKTYKSFLYAVSDDPTPNSLQIFDLSTLPNATKVYDSDTLFSRSHTVFVDGDKLYCGSVTMKTGTYHPMAVYSLADPKKPVLIRALEKDFSSINTVHDMFVRNDTVYASCGYQGLYVFKLKADTTFSMLGSLTQYTEQGYNHSSVLTPDGKTLVFCDEVPAALKVKIADVSNLSDIKLRTVFSSGQGGTPHNPYLIGKDKLVISYYKDGLQIFDINNPDAPYKLGYFDTYPSWNTIPSHPTYAGCWGAYVKLPSQNILASDMQRGLFVLNAHSILAAQEVKEVIRGNVTAYPNPFTDELNIRLDGSFRGIAHVSVFDVLGHLVFEESRMVSPSDNAFKLALPALDKGTYFVSVKDASEKITTIKLIK